MYGKIKECMEEREQRMVDHLKRNTTNSIAAVMNKFLGRETSEVLDAINEANKMSTSPQENASKRKNLRDTIFARGNLRASTPVRKPPREKAKKLQHLESFIDNSFQMLFEHSHHPHIDHQLSGSSREESDRTETSQSESEKDKDRPPMNLSPKPQRKSRSSNSSKNRSRRSSASQEHKDSQRRE